jgi:hypothetical protein
MHVMDNDLPTERYRLYMSQAKKGHTRPLMAIFKHSLGCGWLPSFPILVSKKLSVHVKFVILIGAEDVATDSALVHFQEESRLLSICAGSTRWPFLLV